MTRTIIFILASVLLITVVAYAEHRGPNTPYGDFCSKCSKYGVCQDFMSVDESREAVDGYFDGTDGKLTLWQRDSILLNFLNV